MLSFRNMTEQDLPRVSEVEHSAGSHPWRLNHFIDSLKSNHCCKVAVIDNIIVAQGVIMTVADEAHLLILSVDKQFQGKGIGKALLQHLIEEAKSRQATTLFLEVRESNYAAFELYLNQGFNEIGRRADYYPSKGRRKEDAILMAIDISSSAN